MSISPPTSSRPLTPSSLSPRPLTPSSVSRSLSLSSSPSPPPSPAIKVLQSPSPPPRVSLHQNNRIRKAGEIDDDSRKGIKRRRTRKLQVRKYPPQLSQLLALEGRSIGSLRGKEAADLGTKLHSVCSYIIAPKNRYSHATISTVVFKRVFRRFN